MGMEVKEPDYQKQFQAAVRVIQGLPKDGAYRPSYEEMLRFYSYYKQATVGSCQIPRPGFWDPIGRYKWDAWNSLGKMTREEAMAAYIAEMKKVAQKVIETVPLGETAQDMFVYFEPLYNVIDDMPRPPESFFRKRAGQLDPQPPFQHNGQVNGLPQSHLQELGRGERADTAEEAVESSQVTSDSESEVYCDSLEQVESDQGGRAMAVQSLSLNSPHGAQAEGDGKCGHETQIPESPSEAHWVVIRRSSTEGPGTEADLAVAPGVRNPRGCPEAANKSPWSGALRPELDTQVMGTIHALQDDMQSVLKRLSHLEVLVPAQGCASGPDPPQPVASLSPKVPPYWPLELPPRTLLLLAVWPFVVQWLLWRFQSKKR
uniref:Acyl-CoA binding domain containing 4 n=1 Tax=Sphenodon punctatus TaxID=8508 RepID=A0A8D0GTZ8_SPHPU